MRLTTVVAVCAITLANTGLFAQKVSKAAGSSDFQLQLKNVKQIGDKTLEFDIFIVKTRKDITLEIATFQAGIEYNKELLNGAVVKADMVSIIPGTSEMSDSLKPKMVNSSMPGLIRLAGRPAPKKSRGTTIPEGDSGIRICTIRLTNPVSFIPDIPPDLKFTSSVLAENSYATRLGIYDGLKIIQLDILPGKNAVSIESIQLNPAK